jgi:peptide/nickel transport system substrate-binding protein
MVLKKQFLLALLLAAVIGLAACSPEGLKNLDLPDDIQSDPEPTPIPSVIPPRTLSICLGDEPDSLFIYGDLSTSAKIIRQSIYDGPIDLVDFQYSPVILQELPSQENGLVSMKPVEVFPGQTLVDARGNITVLTSGVVFKPSGCASPECWDVYEDQPSILMDQVSVQFSIAPGIRWSDGAPLVPEDSLFSYRVAQEVYGLRGPARLQYAADYQILEDGVIQWDGLPGYQGIYDYAELFFSPLPDHLWANYTLNELLTSPQTTLYPIGWGAYRALDWIRGDHITLVKNEFYQSGEEDWPAYDFLVFRFVEDGQTALAAYRSGECDLVANTPDLTRYLPELLSQENDGQLELTYIDQPAWEQLSFGIDSLDRSRRFLIDSRTRIAIAMCINREAIAAERVDAGIISSNLYHPLDPRYRSENKFPEYQPEEGMALLEAAGWTDEDLNPATPRKAYGVDGVLWGTTLSLSLQVPGGVGDSPTAEIIEDQLEGCGVDVEIEYLPAAELLSPGPEGPVFGRQFDLALFAWTTGSYHICQIFQTEEIPGMYPSYPKGWGGANLTGYSQNSFDQACQTILTSLPDSEESDQAIQEVQSIFEEDLPVLPLFFRHDVIISRPGLGGIGNGNSPLLVNIELID